MIEYGRFTNVQGNYIDFNDLDVPFNEFTTDVDWRFTEKNKSQEHGIYPGNSYLGKRLFHCSGDLLQNTSADYWDLRRRFIKAILPKSHLGYDSVGTLSLRFTGFNEDVMCECTLDGYPEIPLQALSPSASKYQVNFKAYDPRLYGQWWIVDLPYGVTENIGGRTYNKSFDKTYAAGSGGNDVIISNTGDIETFPIFTIYGPVTSPKIILFRGDGKTLYFTLNGLTLNAASDVVVVDVGKKTAVMNGNFNVYNYAVGSDWWALEPDLTNIVRYTADTGSVASHASVQWRNAYMI